MDIVPAIMSKNLPIISYKVIKFTDLDITALLLRHKRGNGDNLDIESRRTTAKELKEAARNDYNRGLKEVASKIQAEFKVKNCRAEDQLQKN
eukprot:snap_masked-scaffold_12-processed-gene-5.52-mRNA-1 protein AED:1.00 eAED:1.00 QI:0/-1/0/0/-1/1/1/0/91